MRVIAINDAYRLAPWADVLYACDERWWKWQYRGHTREIAAFAGVRYSIDPRAGKWPHVQVLRNTGRAGLERDPSALRHGHNSGYQAVNLAVHFGAARILLLGYDMQATGGHEHWFGHHPMVKRSPYGLFRQHFQEIVKPLREAGVEVWNCSRATALDVFPRLDLETALQQIATVAA